MSYKNKEQDHQKRKDQEGSYSLYNHLYNWLLNNYEPEQLESSYACEAAENLLVDEGKAYCLKGKGKYDESFVRGQARKAIAAFCSNDGEHGDTAGNLGNMQDNSFENIKRTISDLRW